ncbi:MAG: AzlC family ABC transporter permease [Pseudolysinimonas sp.]
MTVATPPDDRARTRAAIRAGVRDGFLLELGYIPFDLAAGAVMAQTMVDPAVSIASGPIIFAGAAQLVAVQLLDAGAAIPLVVLAVFIVNARHLLYSASLEPHLGEWSRPQRLLGAFFLSDPTYALAITRFERPEGAGSKREQLGYYFSTSIVLWVGWAVLLAVGVLFGGLIPPWVPLELAIPLTFLLLVLPLLKDRAGVVAAAVGGVAALLAQPLPFGSSIIIGAVAGLVAGGIVLARTQPVLEVDDA